MKRLFGKEKPEVFHAFQTELKGKQSKYREKKKLVMIYASWRAPSILRSSESLLKCLGRAELCRHQPSLEDSSGLCRGWLGWAAEAEPGRVAGGSGHTPDGEPMEGEQSLNLRLELRHVCEQIARSASPWLPARRSEDFLLLGSMDSMTSP